MPQKRERKRVQYEDTQIETEFQWELSGFEPKAKLHVERIPERFAVKVTITWANGKSSSVDLDTETWLGYHSDYSVRIQEFLEVLKLKSTSS